MSKAQPLRCYAFVDRPYAQVRELLRLQALDLLSRATASTASQARELVANLKLDVGGREIGVGARIHLIHTREDEGVAGLPPVTALEIAWEANRGPGLFPTMRAELAAWPVTADRTQLELTGDYCPPMGLLGDALDAAALHRVAEAVVSRFLQDVARELRHELPSAPREEVGGP